MHITQHSALIVTYKKNFNMKTITERPVVGKEDPSFTEKSMPTPLAFDSVTNII